MASMLIVTEINSRTANALTTLTGIPVPAMCSHIRIGSGVYVLLESHAQVNSLMQGINSYLSLLLVPVSHSIGSLCTQMSCGGGSPTYGSKYNKLLRDVG